MKQSILTVAFLSMCTVSCALSSEKQAPTLPSSTPLVLNSQLQATPSEISPRAAAATPTLKVDAPTLAPTPPGSEKDWDHAVIGIIQDARKNQLLTLNNVLVTRVTRPTPGQTVANLSIVKSIDIQTGKKNADVIAIARHAECIYEAFKFDLVESGPRGFYVLDRRIPQLKATVELPITSLTPAELVLISVMKTNSETIACP